MACEHLAQGLTLCRRQRPKPPTERDFGFNKIEAFFRQVPPSTSRGLGQKPLNYLWPVRVVLVGLEISGQRRLVTGDKLFQNACSRYAGQVRPARRRRQRQAEPDQIVRWIADNGLIKISDLYQDAALRIGERTEIAEMAVAQIDAGGPSGTFPRLFSSHS